MSSCLFHPSTDPKPQVACAGEAAATAVAVQAAGDDDMSNSDDDEEMDLFGDLTPEEQAAADEKKRVCPFPPQTAECRRPVVSLHA